MATDKTLEDRLIEIREAVRELDTKISDFKEASQGRDDLDDARDHLQQIHYRLTECKGHLGAVSYDLKKTYNVL